jgi:hypothetical protein
VIIVMDNVERVPSLLSLLDGIEIKASSKLDSVF